MLNIRITLPRLLAIILVAYLIGGGIGVAVADASTYGAESAVKRAVARDYGRNVRMDPYCKQYARHGRVTYRCEFAAFFVGDSALPGDGTASVRQYGNRYVVSYNIDW